MQHYCRYIIECRFTASPKSVLHHASHSKQVQCKGSYGVHVLFKHGYRSDHLSLAIIVTPMGTNQFLSHVAFVLLGEIDLQFSNNDQKLMWKNAFPSA